jgi:hypothetical protein
MKILSFLLCGLLTASFTLSNTQAQDRRGEPNVHSSGYYVVSSDDNATLAHRPQYFFVDTSYQPSTWRRIATGPRQFAPPGHFFYNPSGWGNISAMDTADNAMAGPIPIGFKFRFYDVEYDSIYISSNGFVGFRPYAEAAGSPLGGGDSYAAGTNRDFASPPSYVNGPRGIIAGLWADMVRTRPDSSKVFIRTNAALDTCMINWYMLKLKPAIPNVVPQYKESDRLFIQKMQIIITKRDSSIQINYGPFMGSTGTWPPVGAASYFQANSSIGVVNQTRTQATSVLYKDRWDAVSPNCTTCNNELKQAGQWALKFKQYTNKTRVIRIDAPAQNSEVCLGNAITPKATFRNVSESMQNLRAIFRIDNAINGANIYVASVDVMNLAAGKDTTITFATLTTNPNILSQLGRQSVMAIAAAITGNGSPIVDAWPFDDTLRTTMFGLRRTAIPFQDPSNSYSANALTIYPDQYKFISLGATVVEGDSATFDAPSPRDPEQGYGSRGLHSPVIKLDRLNDNGVVYVGTANGDTITSYPINLSGQTKVNLSFDYHRSSKRLYEWKYDFVTLYGSESTILDTTGNVVRKGDSLILEFKKPTEAACNPATSGWTQVAAIDGGKDMEFQRFNIAVESKNVGGTNYFNSDFRFRLRLKAKADLATTSAAVAKDDEDPWYIDNIELNTPRRPEIAVKWVRVVSAYSKVPASQAFFPVYVKIANNGASMGQPVPIVVQVLGPDGKTKYYQRKDLLIAAGKDTIVEFPTWDATSTSVTAGRECKVNAFIGYSAFDAYPDDDYAYSTFYMPVESGSSLTHEFAYDDAGISPMPGAGNDMPTLMDRTGAGAGFNNSTGSFAIKFKVIRRDTVYGARIYFGRGNAANDPIRISVREGSNTSLTPGALVNNDATMQDERRGNFYDQFWSYYFPKPIVLDGELDGGDGIYWLSVSQLGIDNMMIGADVSRRAYDYRVSDISINAPFIHRSPYGTQYDANLNSGNISGAVAFEATAGSGNWSVFNPEYSIAMSAGLSTNVNFVPMMRPLVSRRELLPVEYAKPLAVSAIDNTALLTWTTATETNNRGFFVERLLSTGWEKITFVESRSSNSSSPNGYTYADENLIAGTYSYRLIQMDLDGSESLSNVVEVTIANQSRVSFAPNPFDPATGASWINIDPSLGEIKITVVNALGQTVRTLSGASRINFDGKDDLGKLLPSGSYIIRLQAQGLDEVRRISIIR